MRRVTFLLVMVALLAANTVIGADSPSFGQEVAVSDLVQVGGEFASADKTVDGVTTTERWVVEMATAADLTAARRVTDRDDRVEAVRAALVQTASRSQAAVVELLEQRRVDYSSHWLVNELVFTGDAALAAALKDLPGVAGVRHERVYPLVEPVVRAAAPNALGPEWGIDKIGAPAVWAEGILGEGVVVANLDTGVDYTHPALIAQYRGNNDDGTFTHEYNFWDATGLCLDDAPCDDAAHGTHTMGTMVGGDGPGPSTDDIGVAPGATWIAARGCEDFGCSESALLGAGEFLTAPWDAAGENPDPSLAPDIINNSWGGPPADPFFAGVVEAWSAAGIIAVFSSGNEGPSCSTAGSPGDFADVISAGATDIDDVIGDFSSRGPTLDDRVKPDLSAPGVDVVSSVPGGGYESFSGTSMAAPHVAGSIALMMSAEPGLVGDFDAIAGLLGDTAVDIVDLSCGGDPSGDPNNVYGDGRLDALLATLVARDGAAVVGTVTDAGNGDPVAGASVVLTGDVTTSDTTAVDGTYSVRLPAGDYSVEVAAFGYFPATAGPVSVAVDETETVDVALEASPRFVVSGVVSGAETGNPLAGATVAVLDAPVEPAETATDGSYEFLLPVGDYTLRASLGGCISDGVETVSVVDAAVTVDMLLARKIDQFGYGCTLKDLPWIDAKVQSALYGDDVYGRLALPFPFEFYGETYHEVFISSNGYVSFVDPFYSSCCPSPIPLLDGIEPAAYALWQDLVLDASARIDYGVITTSGKKALVIEFHDVAQFFAEGRVSFEIVLWSTGVIDYRYGLGTDDVGGGAKATIGIENASATDALEHSFLERTVEAGTSIRIAPATDARIVGSVLNANDGRPVAGASVVAEPGTRLGTTDDRGRFALNVISGDYVVSAGAPLYGEDSAQVFAPPDGEVSVELVLPAARAKVRPLDVDVALNQGARTKARLRLRNLGGLPLEWSTSVFSLPDAAGGAPFVPQALGRRQPSWAQVPGSGGRDLTDLPVAQDLPVVVEDPAGDATGPPDVALLSAGSAGDVVQVRFDLVEPSGAFTGFMFLDVDQDPATGASPEEWFGLPSQDVGLEFVVDMFGVADGYVLVVDTATFEIVAEGAATFDGSTAVFDLPRELFPVDVPGVDTAAVVGDFDSATDWVPDAGHGTIATGEPVTWLRIIPESGNVEPGVRVPVRLRIKANRLEPGSYDAVVQFRFNDPRRPIVWVTVTLTVT